MSADSHSDDSPTLSEETYVWCTFECEDDLAAPIVRVVANGPDGRGELSLELPENT